MKSLTLMLILTLVISVFAVVAVPAQAADYTDEQWEQLIEKYRDSLFGGSDVDWSDPQICAIVEEKNENGLTSSGIAYQGGKYWIDLERNRSNLRRIFGTMDITMDIPSSNMGYQFLYLQYLSRAYATPGAEYTYKDDEGKVRTLKLYGNPELRSAILYGLEKSLVFYNQNCWDEQKNSPRNTQIYNWWDWAYQAPVQIGRILMALYPYEKEEEKTITTLANTALDLVNQIRPNNHSNPTTQMEHRRTRMNIIPVLAAVVKDGSLMDETRTNLAYFLRNDYTYLDGVKQDGSYICHGRFAMEGRYGIDVLISRVIDTYSILYGTAFEPVTYNSINQFYWMMDVFKPLMMDSGIMAQSNGREPQSGLSMGPVVVKGALKLLGCFGPQEDLQLKQFIRQIIVGHTEEETYKAYTRYASAIGDVNLIHILRTVTFNQKVAEDGELYAVMRYKSDRAVQHRENYSVGIAMSSNRIAPYESISGRNRYGWFTGDGVVYVYNDTTTYDYDQYGEDFQRFANMHRLPGVTQEADSLREPWSDRMHYYPGMTYTYDVDTRISTWKKDLNARGQYVASFVGGVEMESQYIAAAMDFESYNWTSEESAQEIAYIHTTDQKDENAENNKTKQVLVSDLTAKKSYFLFDDEIVCVGSDIDFSTREGDIYTYVDNRELMESQTVEGVPIYGTEDILVDGVLLEKANAFSQPMTYRDPTWVHQENFGGYYFPQGGEIGINKTFRVSSNDGDQSNDDYNKYYLGITPETEQHSFFELWLNHGSKPKNGTYAYVMLPEKTPEETASYTQQPDVTILCANDSVHVIREHTLGITAMVFWQAGSYEEITVSQPCILMIREQTGKYTISVSDPTQSVKTAYVTINRRLFATNVDSRITISGEDMVCLDLNFNGIGGKTLTGEFAVPEPEHMMFDFDVEDRDRFSSSLYGYKDYSNARNWATGNLGGASVTIANGFLSVPLTTLNDSAGEPIGNTYIEPSDGIEHFAWDTSKNYANFLGYDPRQGEIFQIRLKLTDAVQYGTHSQGISLHYLPKGSDCWSNEANTPERPNPARETIKMSLPDSCLEGGSLEDRFITLTYDLRDTKFVTYEQIQGIMIGFDNMRQGAATVDYIYIGPETDHLYFDFNNDAAAQRYDRGAYGGYRFDSESGAAWATACTESAGKRYSIDNEKGTLSLYTGTDYYGTLGVDEHYGPYLETTGKSGTYPWSDQRNHVLSYNPEPAEILEIRFRTEALTQGTEQPRMILLYCGEKDGVSTRYSYGSTEFSLEHGEYQTLRMTLPPSFTGAEYIKSLGFRFRGVKAETVGSVGKIEIDYIYVGPEAHAPSEGIFFDFTNTPEARGRYEGEAYGGLNFDETGWSWSDRGTAPVMDHEGGTMSVTMKPDEAGHIYVQTGYSLHNGLPLNFNPRDAEYIQLRFKLENFVPYTTTRMTLSYYTNENSHINQKDTLKRVGVQLLSEEEVRSGEYITMTFPVPRSMRSKERITAFRMDLYGCTGKSLSQPGVITYDYLFVGEKDRLPMPYWTLSWCDEKGELIRERQVLTGETGSYVGQPPRKESDTMCHYRFIAWVNETGKVADVSSVSDHMKLYPVYEGKPHKLLYSRITATTHVESCSECEYSAKVKHDFKNGICICGGKEIPETEEGATLTVHN